MASFGGRATLCLLLLAVFADLVLCTQIGTMQLYNGADYDMTIRNKVHFVNGSTVVDTGYTPLLKSTVFSFQVVDTMDTVSTLFSMQTSAPLPLHQLIVDWSSITGAMPVPCAPNCFWVVDDNGFSVASEAHAPLTFVAAWD